MVPIDRYVVAQEWQARGFSVIFGLIRPVKCGRITAKRSTSW